MNILLTNKQKINQISLIFKNLKNISTDVEMHVSEKGIYVQGMDAGHVCLFELDIKAFWFDEFDINDEKKALGLNCEMIYKIINCKEEYHNIRIKTDDSDRLTIVLFPQEGQSGFTKEFEIPLIDIDCNLLEIPDVEYDADIEMVSTDTSNLINQLSMFGKDLNVKCNEKITFKGTGEFGTMSAIIEEEQICMYAIAEDTEVNLTFGIEYLFKDGFIFKVEWYNKTTFWKRISNETSI